MSQTPEALLISCPDRPGLIHRITGVILRHGFNIIENHEFVDRETHTFFMRTEVIGKAAAGQHSLLEEMRSELPDTTVLELRDQRPRRLVLFATKEPHCLGDLLLRHASGELRAECLAVVSQYDSLKGLVERFGVPFHVVPVEGTGAAAPDMNSAERRKHEIALESIVDPYRPDFLVMAKYMRILSPAFVAKYSGRILNIHHSFLPAFVGKNPYAQAHARGVKIIGATAHIVTDNLDEGPILTQSVIPINHAMSPSAMARAGRDVEKIVLARALGLMLENRVLIHGQRTVVFE